MSYVVRKSSGSWELRESLATSSGPRSRTLASFRELTRETIRRAQDRAASPLDADDVRRAAQRGGAPVLSTGRLGGRLLAELTGGQPPTPGLRRLLVEALGASPRDRPTDNERAAAQWLDRSPEQRGEALRDLLLLADALPSRRRGPAPEFPRIASSPT